MSNDTTPSTFESSGAAGSRASPQWWYNHIMDLTFLFEYELILLFDVISIN